MFWADAGANPEFMSEVWRLVQIATVAMLAGWAAEQLLDTGIRVRGLPLFCGIAGLYLGSWLWAMGGWDSGPTIAGEGILPLCIGTLAVSGIFKLVSLGAAGPRW
jgi:hypothetical protein